MIGRSAVGGFSPRFVLIGVGRAAVNSHSFLRPPQRSEWLGAVLCNSILVLCQKSGFGRTCGLPGSIPKNPVGPSEACKQEDQGWCIGRCLKDEINLYYVYLV